MFVYTAIIESDDDAPTIVSVHATREGALKHAAATVAETASRVASRVNGGGVDKPVSFTERVHLSGGSMDNPVDVLKTRYRTYWEPADGSMVFTDGHESLTIERTEVLG